MYTINELKVLNLLLGLDKDSPTNALKLKDILKHNESETLISPKLSESTIRRSLKKFIADGYVKEGIKKINNKTYFISVKGIKFINNNYEEDENNEQYFNE